jgi:hypothetical protein
MAQHNIIHGNPWMYWSWNQEKPLIARHKITAWELFGDQHYHLYVRYWFVDAMRGGCPEEIEKWRNLYKKMQLKRVGRVDIEWFSSLIQNFREQGFNSDHPIPVDSTAQILDGAHRAACSAVFGHMPEVEVFSQRSHSYNREWFRLNGFSDAELQDIDELRLFADKKLKSIDEDARVVFIWGYALDFWDEILQEIQAGWIQRATIKDFWDNIANIIAKTYEWDGMSWERILLKAKKISERDTKVGIIIARHTAEEILVIKRRIREALSPRIPDYFFDCIIHAVDETCNGHRIVREIAPL